MAVPQSWGFRPTPMIYRAKPRILHDEAYSPTGRASEGLWAAATDASDQVSDHRVIWLLYELYHIAFCLPFTSIRAHCVGCQVLCTPSPLFNYRPTICECHSLKSNDHFPVDFEMRVISSTRLPWRLTQVMCHVEEAVNYGTKNSIRSAGISRAPY